MPDTTLYRFASKAEITIGTALESFGPIVASATRSEKPEQDGQIFALLYAPSTCHLALLVQDGETWKFENCNKIVDIRAIYEARVFNHLAEMRWLHTATGKGKAAIVAEEDLRLPEDKWEMHTGQIVDESLDQTYLLWGKSTGITKDGWTQFSTARVGSFYVPLKDLPKDTYAQFTASEYFKEHDYGNVAVLDERLTGLTKHEVRKEKNNG